MGQKINPIIFRQSITKPEISSWIGQKDQHANLQQQDLEIRNFMSFLLRSQGIFLRSCQISRSSRKLLVEADFYFSYLLAKESKFLWAKNLFRTIKKKYVELKKMRDLKNFLEEIQEEYGEPSKFRQGESRKKAKCFLLQQKRTKAFLPKKKQNFVFKTGVLTYKHRFFFYLLRKKKKSESFLKKDKLAILGGVKNSSQSSLLRLKFGKLKKLFALKKFKYNFQKFHLKDSLRYGSPDKKDLLKLNQALCRSLHNFTGFEDIHLRIYSRQLQFLPSFKLHRHHIEDKLRYLQRSKDLSKYFSEGVERMYFVLGTFTYGNAALLGKLISYMIENNRKHTSSVRFIKKSLQIFFQNLPSSFFAIEGIKILIKGRFNKRRRTKTMVIQEGQISLQTIQTPIDYYQTQAITLYGAFGIKVWLAKKQALSI